MKTSILLAALLVISSFSIGQTYQKIYPQSPLLNNTGVGLVSSGFNDGTAFALLGYFSVADSLGNIIAGHSLPFSYSPSQIIRTSDGGYLICTCPSQAGLRSVQYASLTKCDSLGNTLWQKFLSDTFNINSFNVKLDNAGNIYMLMDSFYSFSTLDTIMLKKYDAGGNALWSKGVDRQTTASFTVGANGNVLLLGQVSTNHIVTYIRQLDVNGDSVWQRNYSHPSQYYPYDIVTLPSGALVSLSRYQNYTYKMFISITDASGLLLDSVAIPGYAAYSGACKLGVSTDGSITVYTTSVDSVTGLTDAVLTDISSSGLINWQRVFLGLGHETALDICPLSNGFILSGYVGTGNAVSAVFIDRLDLSGQFYGSTIIDSTFFVYSDYQELDTNNIASGFNTHGDLFSRDTIGVMPSYNFGIVQRFRVPKSGLAHAIFTGNIWIAGKDNGGNLYSSSECYGSNYQPGPFGILPNEALKWNKIWSVLRTEVLSVKDDYDAHHAITQPVPASVLAWPAKGNASATGNHGASLIVSQDMAPFVDRNGDGVYNVYDGDYPLIRGDKMLWWINNDEGSQSQNPMGVDRRYSAWEYNSLTDSNLNNTLFMSVKIKNESGQSYNSVKIGSFVDFDLGCANNDRVGSIPSKNTFYVYNGYVSGATQVGGITCDEGSVCPTGEVGYGCTLPIMSATFLNDSMTCFTYNTNGAGSAQSDPSIDLSYYNHMSGIWNDGTPMTYGGTGYGGTTPYPFAFPGNPADATQWSECNQQTGPAIAAGDRRSYAAIGPFSLAAGDTISFDMAFIFHEGPYDNCPDVSDSSAVYQHIDSIRSYYNSERFPQWYDSTKSLSPAYYTIGINDVAPAPVFSLIPNPNNGSFNIHISNLSQADYTVSVTDMLGQQVYSSAVHSTDQSIHLDNANSGVYSVTIESKSYRETRKVVITK